jgi:hypothetical protein
MHPLARASLVVLLLAPPLAARAGLDPGLTLLGAPSAHLPAARLDVPALALATPAFRLAPLAEGAGGMTGDRQLDQVLSLVLGIVPGFGIGHLVAGSPRWITWLAVDVAILAAWVAVAAVDPRGPIDALVFVAVVAERLIEGYDAFREAGGRFVVDAAGPPPARAFARPVRDPGLGLAGS